jgi:hypothetical protein
MNRRCVAGLVALSLSLPLTALADDLMSGLPTPPDSKPLGETKSIHDNGMAASYTSSATPSAVLDAYKKNLPASGWTVEGSGGGGSSWGGGGGLSAANGAKYLYVNAGGPSGKTYVNVCVWPTKPHNTSCDENN